MRQSRAFNFTKALHGRKQPIRGLWIRNGRYYAQLTFEDGHTGLKQTRCVPRLDKEQNPVSTVPQAVEEMNRLRVKRSDKHRLIMITRRELLFARRRVLGAARVNLCG